MFISFSLFADNMNKQIDNKKDLKLLKKEVKNYKNFISAVFNYKFDIKLNDIPYNYDPYHYSNSINTIKFVKKEKIRKKQKKEFFIVKIIPKILLNNKVFVKYIKISKDNKYERTFWVQPGDEFEDCKFLNIHGTKMKFKCGKKIIKTEFLPKIKFN